MSACHTAWLILLPDPTLFRGIDQSVTLNFLGCAESVVLFSRSANQIAGLHYPCLYHRNISYTCSMHTNVYIQVIPFEDHTVADGAQSRYSTQPHAMSYMLTQRYFAHRLAIHFVKLLYWVDINRQHDESLSQHFKYDFWGNRNPEPCRDPYIDATSNLCSYSQNKKLHR